MWFTDRLDGAAVAFTDASEGNLAAHTGEDPDLVAAHRAGLESSLGVSPGAVRFLHQVHGTDVAVFGSEARGIDPDGHEAPVADAAISVDGTPLAVLTADCLPVVFVADRSGSELPLLAVAHAGRRGLLDGVLQNTVRALREHGGARITAWVGPAICGSCYEVPEEMRTESARVLPGIESETSWHTPGLDLPGAARGVLTELGVRLTEAVTDRSQWCTLEHDALYSYRRDKTTHRLAGVVWTPAVPTSPGKDTA